MPGSTGGRHRPPLRAARKDLCAVRAAVHVAEEVGAGLGDGEVLQRALPSLAVETTS